MRSAAAPSYILATRGGLLQHVNFYAPTPWPPLLVWSLEASVRISENNMKISDLSPFQDCEVALHVKDGEVLRAKVAFVDLEHEDIIVHVLETNQPEHYKDPNASYAVAASDIVSVRNSTDERMAFLF
jgi:hypothetical protein